LLYAMDVNAPAPDELMTRLQALAQELPLERRLELIKQLTAAGVIEPSPASDSDSLRELYASYRQQHEFEPGQLVRWKPQLRNKRLPDYDQQAIVMSTLAEPVINTSEPSDSPYYREQLDLVLGVIDGSGDLICFHFDAHRFEPATPG
jgi:hypothetical protein